VIEIWLDSPVWVMLLTLALFHAVTAGLLYWLSFHGRPRTWIARFRDVEGPVFGAAALLFAMLTGFVASDVWHRNDEAFKLVANEGAALDSIGDVARAAGVSNAALAARIRDYARVVVAEEWPSMGAGKAAPHAEESVLALLREVLEPRYAAAGPLVQSTLFQQVINVRSLRSQRIVISSERTDEFKWAGVLALSVLTQIALALMHLDKPKPMLATLAVFSMASFVGLGLVAVQESPFTYPLQVSPAPIERILQTVPPGEAFPSG
jgi:hypothetical protein